MPSKTLRQTVALPASTAQRVRGIAKSRQVSSNRVLVELIEAGLESKEQEKKRFFELSDRLAETKDAAERQQIKQILSKMVFGE